MKGYCRQYWYLMIVLMVPQLAACWPQYYRSAAFEGRVVDAETGEPLEDVVVVAEWLLEGRPFHPDVIGRLHLEETVTDGEGRYRFPKWGPLRVKEGRLYRFSPILSFYKRGYVFTEKSNTSFASPDVPVPNLLRSQWDGKDIALKPYTGALTTQSSVVDVGGVLSLFSVDEEKCAWQLFPRMTAELLKRELEYQEKGESSGVPSRVRLYQNGRCLDPDQLLKENNNEKKNSGSHGGTVHGNFQPGSRLHGADARGTLIAGREPLGTGHRSRMAEWPRSEFARQHLSEL
jgi:hypothetical protein